MDLSKLPKFSQTPAPPGPAVDPPAAATSVELFCRCGAPIAGGTNFCSNCGASYRDVVSGGGEVRPAGAAAEVGLGSEAWLSFALAAVMIFMAPNIWKYYFSPASISTVYFDVQGNPTSYRLTEFYWTDLGLGAFSVVLVFEGLVMLLARKKALLLTALALTIAVTGLNVYVLSRSYGLIGFPVLNALAGAFGVYIALYEFAVLRSLRTRPR